LGAIDTMHIAHAFEYGDDKHENYEQNKLSLREITIIYGHN